ncbi:MAG: hypothetical protein E6I66_11620 [Chloroflexi bacterium]|nr:MAG: hypothetical protein E6I66_11620 [Chloroflexota bacterium]
MAAVARDDRRSRGDGGMLRDAAHRLQRDGHRPADRRGPERSYRPGRRVLAYFLGRRDPRHRSNTGPGIARSDPHDHRRRAPRSSSHRATARPLSLARLGRSRYRACRGIPDRERARGARELTIAAAPLVLAVAACGAFVLRKRLNVVGPFSLAAIVVAVVLLVLSPLDVTGTLLDLELRATGLGRLASGVILATLFLLVLYVWLDEPAYNFFPTALAVGATSLGVLVLTAPLAIFGLLVLGLLVPVGSFTFQVHRNRSVEAATRHFGFVALGGCLGIAALALAASLPHEQPANTFVLLVVVLVVAFALLLAAIPFHTHAALLAGEVPPSALALYFGVLVPTTFIAFVEILTLSGLLPAIVQVVKVQDLLHGIGLTSAVGGAFLATGAPDLRRLVVYSVISNLGAALVGIATLSGPGIIGALASVIVTGASASGQLLAAGTLERRSAPERPIARKAPLAALAFVVGGFAMIGAPPLLGFPGRFFMELIAYQFAPLTGTALVLATLLLIVGQLRALLALFGSGVERWFIEPRPVAGIVGAVIFVALLIGGIQPDGFLRPIASFALRALRPL